MTEHRETTRYATPYLTYEMGDWLVSAQPYGQMVGRLVEYNAGWLALTAKNRFAGLWPTKQAAAEVLVKQAGYELEMG